jgi:purine-cytosine permease-like protein
MNTLKRLLGIVWIALGPVVLYWLILTGISEIAKKPVIDTKIQWGIFIGIFIPIVIGLMIFGYYALRGEYGSESRQPPTL